MVTPAAMAVVPGTPFRVPPAPLTPAKFGVRPAEGSAGDLGPEQKIEETKVMDIGFEGPVSPTSSEQPMELQKLDHMATGESESETTEEDSEQSTSDSDVEAVNPPAPVIEEPSLRFYINEKSLVIHRERSQGLLKCGRKVSPHFMVVYELHGIRCSRCFDV